VTGVPVRHRLAQRSFIRSPPGLGGPVACGASQLPGSTQQMPSAVRHPCPPGRPDPLGDGPHRWPACVVQGAVLCQAGCPFRRKVRQDQASDLPASDHVGLQAARLPRRSRGNPRAGLGRIGEAAVSEAAGHRRPRPSCASGQAGQSAVCLGSDGTTSVLSGPDTGPLAPKLCGPIPRTNRGQMIKKA
jgi:hypothetical protein